MEGGTDRPYVIRTHDIRAREYTSVGNTHLNTTVAFKHIPLKFVY